MKKFLSILLVAGMTSLVACGPSAEEKAAAEAAEKATQDSLNLIKAQEEAAASQATADSLARIAAEKATADSIANAAAEAAKKKPASKPKTQQQKKEEDKKVLQKQKG